MLNVLELEKPIFFTNLCFTYNKRAYVDLLQTNLEAIGEACVAALDHKTPSVKAETASFLARCFAKCTPASLPKKTLKLYIAPLLKVCCPLLVVHSVSSQLLKEVILELESEDYDLNDMTMKHGGHGFCYNPKRGCTCVLTWNSGCSSFL